MMLALQLFLSLSLLIILHEGGHFLPAKLFKIRVEKFYLFFDPWFSIFKKKVGGTEYGIGWLPLGGYVKIAGMIDESMDKEQMSKPAEDWEFRSKPAWQRLIVMVGGVVVNVIVGMILYAVVLANWGKDELPVQNITYGVHCDSLMMSIGFHEGDRVIALDGQTPSSYTDIPKWMLLNKPTTATVIRNGAEVQIPLPTELGQMMVDQGVKMPFTPRIPCVVDTVIAGTPAADAGLMKGDSLVSLDGDTLLYFQAIQQYLKSHPDKPVQVGLYRQGKWMTITPQVTAEGTIGFAPKSPDKYFTYVNRDYGFLEAIPAGVSEAWETVKDYASQLKFIFSASGAKQVGGFATFAKLFPEEWNWAMFWERTAFISLILAFMNILPIPALDGGHVMFLLWEMITGRPASQRIMEVAQMIGMVLLLGLMLYGNGMDIFRWITSH